MSVTSKLVMVGEAGCAVVVLEDGTVLTADHNHARFDEIRERITNQNFDGIEKVFSVGQGIITEFEKIGTRVTIRDDKLFFEGEELDDSLADLIVRLYNEDADYEPFLEFLEKLQNNPNKHSIENLFRWLRNGSFAINYDGNILAYKGVRDDYTSVTAGPAIVNGKPFNGHIPNSVDNIIEMDRGNVQHNPSVGCSVGLHAGTWGYAKDFGSKVVLVEIDPRDVVSVPTDCNDQKMRVCRYVVHSTTESELDSNLWGTKIPKIDESDDDFEVEDDDDFEVEDEDDVEDYERKFATGDRVVLSDEEANREAGVEETHGEVMGYDPWLYEPYYVITDDDLPWHCAESELTLESEYVAPEQALKSGDWVRVTDYVGHEALSRQLGKIGQVQQAFGDSGTLRGTVTVDFEGDGRWWIETKNLALVAEKPNDEIKAGDWVKAGDEVGKVRRIANYKDEIFGTNVAVLLDDGSIRWYRLSDLEKADEPVKGKTDTTKNHLSLRRGPDGRFLPKES